MPTSSPQSWEWRKSGKGRRERKEGEKITTSLGLILNSDGYPKYDAVGIGVLGHLHLSKHIQMSTFLTRSTNVLSYFSEDKPGKLLDYSSLQIGCNINSQ